MSSAYQHRGGLLFFSHRSRFQIVKELIKWKHQGHHLLLANALRGVRLVFVTATGKTHVLFWAEILSHQRRITRLARWQQRKGSGQSKKPPATTFVRSGSWHAGAAESSRCVLIAKCDYSMECHLRLVLFVPFVIRPDHLFWHAPFPGQVCYCLQPFDWSAVICVCTFEEISGYFRYVTCCYKEVIFKWEIFIKKNIVVNVCHRLILIPIMQLCCICSYSCR